MTAGITVWDTYAQRGDRAIRQGNFSEAETCWFRALRIAEYFGERDPRLCISLERLSQVYDMTNRHDHSLMLAKQAAKLNQGARRSEPPQLPESDVSNKMFDNSSFGYKMR